MSDAIPMIAAALKQQGLWQELPEEPAEGVCCLTGERGPTLRARQAFLPTFVDRDLFRAPHTGRASVDVWQVLKHRPTRISSWICEGGEIRFIKKVDLVELIYEPRKPPWCGYITTSYKKHGALRAPVNTGQQARWQFENEQADLTDMAAFKRLADWVLRLRIAGVPRGALEDLEPSLGIIRAIGIAEWTRFVEFARPQANTPTYRLACYLLPSEADIKKMKRDEPQAQEEQDPAPAIQDTGQLSLF